MKHHIVNINADPWLEQLSKQLLSNVPEDARIIHDGRNRLMTVSPKGTEGEINIKAFRIPISINQMAYGWIRKSKARRSFEYALRLHELGIDTPLPYGYVEEFNKIGWLKRSFYICRQLDENWHTTRYIEKREDFDEIVDSLAAWVASLHEAGIYFKDLSPGNVMMRTYAPGKYKFQLVDLNRMSFGYKNRKRQLSRAGWLIDSESGTRRFATKYAEASGLDPQWCTTTVMTAYYRLQLKATKHQLRKTHKSQSDR